jgi:hypothetical protein
MAVPQEELQKWLTDVRSVLEFVTEKLSQVELAQQQPNVQTPLTDLATSCQRSTLNSAKKGSPPPAPPISLPSQPAEEQVADVAMVHPFAIQAPSQDEMSLVLDSNPVQNDSAAHSVSFCKSFSAAHFLAEEKPPSPRKLLLNTKGEVWEPMRRQDVHKYTVTGTIRWYWIGLTYNMKLRSVYMQLRAKVATLRTMAAALNEDLMEDEEAKLEENREQLHAMGCGAEIGSMTLASTCFAKTIEKEAGNDDVEIILSEKCLTKLERLLKLEWTIHGIFKVYRLTTDQVLQMASCPLDEFMEHYITDRNDALSRKISSEKRIELTKATLKGVAEFEILCDDLRDRITANDQLFFKLFLMLINIFTCVGQYCYDYFFPEEIYKCEKRLGN